MGRQIAQHASIIQQGWLFCALVSEPNQFHFVVLWCFGIAGLSLFINEETTSVNSIGISVNASKYLSSSNVALRVSGFGKTVHEPVGKNDKGRP